MMNPQSISIIVPVTNEAALIRPFLQQLRDRAPGAEVIVVDGGSSDGTRELARDLTDQVITSSRGRGVQMNSGAERACNDILWFLHADSDVPHHCLEDIRSALVDARVAGGYFRIRLPRRGWIYRFQDSFGFYVGRILRIRCGDHGIFCRREVFAAAGGYADVPLMEDVGLVRQLYCAGRVMALPTRIITSLRRQDEVGPYRYTAACVLIVMLYCIGFSEAFLARLYSRMVPCRQVLEDLPPLPAAARFGWAISQQHRDEAR